MATFKWAGDVVAVAQVDTVQITGMDATPANTTYILTVGGKTVQVVGDTDEDTTAVALAAAWNASTEPEFAEVTATVATDTVTLTGDTPGTPFTAVSSVSGGTGTIGAVTSSTANDGPNTWSANNFIDQSDDSRGTLPGAGDTVLIQDSNVDIKYNLDQNAAGADLTLKVFASYTGQIGLPEVNADGAAYTEYRPRQLNLDTTVLQVGKGQGNGSPKLRLKTDNDIATMTVFSTGAATANEKAVEISLATTTLITANIFGGSVEINDITGDSAVTTLNMKGGADVSLVGAFTDELLAINADGTSVLTLPPELASNTDTINIRGGTVISRSADSITSLNIFSGSFVAQQAGAYTIAALVVGPTGIMDTTLSAGIITLTNTTLNGDATGAGELRDPNARLKFTNPIDIGFGKVNDFPIDVGAGRTVTFSDPT